MNLFKENPSLLFFWLPVEMFLLQPPKYRNALNHTPCPVIPGTGFMTSLSRAPVSRWLYSVFSGTSALAIVLFSLFSNRTFVFFTIDSQHPLPSSQRRLCWVSFVLPLSPKHPGSKSPSLLHLFLSVPFDCCPASRICLGLSYWPLHVFKPLHCCAHSLSLPH